MGDRMMFVRDEFFLSYGHMVYKVVFDNFLSSFIWWGKVLNLRGVWSFS